MRSIVIAHDDTWYASIHLRCDDTDYIRRVMTFLEKNHLAKNGWRFKVVERRKNVVKEDCIRNRSSILSNLQRGIVVRG